MVSPSWEEVPRKKKKKKLVFKTLSPKVRGYLELPPHPQAPLGDAQRGIGNLAWGQ